MVWGAPVQRGIASSPSSDISYLIPPDSIPDSLKLRYPIKDDYATPFTEKEDKNPVYLKDPSNISSDIEYDPETNQYVFTKKMGALDYRTPHTMTFEEYQKYDMNKGLQRYWREQAKNSGLDKQNGIIPQLRIGSEVFEKIFGNNTIDIRPQGSAELIFGVISNRREDPSLNVRQRRTTNFDFQEKIQMNVVAKIGDKIEFNTNYNTEATFSFENKLKLKYEGKEDEIIKLIEAGDVSLPLNSTLITGSQSLFGIKTKLQFGRATITSIYSEQKSETKNITVSGGAQMSTFKLEADQYEENKHFFIAQYFGDHYNEALEKLPLVSSSVNIIKMEVWKTNIGPATTENRNIAAFMDLGEYTPYNKKVISPIYGNRLPTNNSNDLLHKMDTAKLRNINTVSTYLKGAPFNFVSGVDFEKVESAKKLSSSEYTYNSRLGFISLNSTLNPDQVLAVAFQYTILGDSTVYQVGEFSNDVADPKCLIVKLLKSTSLNTHIPLWNLMMKNVYALGGYQINSADFRLNILYSGDENGVPTGYFTEGSKKGIPLIRLVDLDNLNFQLDPVPDGVFDFIDNAATTGGTVQSSNGRVYFPVREPFGKDLRRVLVKNAPDDSAIANKYAYDSLYTMTKKGAQQYPDKNKFIIEGSYKSQGGSEIALGAWNVPQGSVKVTAGGIPLTENVDYTVDYTLGRVKIINEGILNSGTPINISLENNAMFNIQTKRLMGTHIDYMIHKNFNVGATILNLTERPLTQKVNFGDEPISNTIWGFDLAYQTESRLLTKLIDKLPFISTKTPSTINFNGEFANLIPGHSRAIGKSGTSYIDDFEGSKSTIDLKNIGAWHLASTPQKQLNLFPEAAEGTGLAYGFNRAKLAWYVIDPLFYRNTDATPSNITTAEQSKPYSREVLETEVFPNKEVPNGEPTNIAMLNLAYYPTERGPYNFDTKGTPSISSGLDTNGSLKNPDTRWGGMMRKMETTDFDATNVEYIEFWMMDPFIENPNHSGGELYFNLGDVSEDILRDGRKSFENGLPTSANVINVDTTIWGRVPTLPDLVNAFDNDPNARGYQDVGYDGLKNNDELAFFDSAYIKQVESLFGTTSNAYLNATTDPAGDDYHYFRGTDYDNQGLTILDRYKKYNNPDGNSPTSAQSPEKYPTLETTNPDVEDINRDNTLSEDERYFQYKIDLRPNKMNVGENYISDIHVAQGIQLPDQSIIQQVKWYQFKIPVRKPDKVVGDIQDFQSIRFMRAFFKNFTQPVICRLATFELVRSEWRKYNYDLLSPGEYVPTDLMNNTDFEVATVSIEENGKRIPIPYVLPPGIDREINQGTTNLQKLNEQSLVLKVCDLIDGDAKAVYKTTDFDLRQFKKLKMFIHAEKSIEDQELNYGDLTVFVRLGSDFTENYYEYEIPLTFTPWYTSVTNDYAIWPTANDLDIDLNQLVEVKQERNVLMRQPNSTITAATPYIKYDGANKITVVGVPTVSDVRTIMIGIRNPKRTSVASGDDGRAKCAEVWVDELRLTDFEKKGGWAATATVKADLADLGNITLSGNTSTPGFGSIEKKITELQKEYINEYGVSTSLELGKFFPENFGLRIPMHYDYSKSVSTPQYNPLNPDVLLKEDLKTYNTKEERDSIKKVVQGYTHRKNLNFINVRKDKVGQASKSHVYDIENFDFTYAYSEVYTRNVDIEYDLQKNYKGGIGYNFNNNPKNIKPFAKSKTFKSPWFALIRDFNFYYLPRQLTFRTDLDRSFNENLMRSRSTGIIIIEPTFVKIFDWNRSYGLKFDFTQSLKLDFTANANARIDEPQGRIDTKQERDSVWHNVFNLGRMNRYTQSMSINYAIPIHKIPLLNWISLTARYGCDYRWESAVLSLKSLGNFIENSNTKQLNGTFTMNTLYNKIGYLRKLNESRKKSNRKSNLPTDFSNTEEDSTKADRPQINYFKVIADNALKILMGVKNISFTYNENNGTLLPGFKYRPYALGQDWDLNAPGLGFVFGSQRDIRSDAVNGGWLTQDTLLNNAYITKYSQNYNIRTTIEPINELRIELTADRNYSEIHQEYFKADKNGNFNSFSPSTTGNFSISFSSWRTAFIKENKDYTSSLFDKFKNYRQTVAMRLAEQNPSWDQGFFTDTVTGQKFPNGYGPLSQEVLVPAFLAAYSGKNPDKISLNPFIGIPKPNWRITYTGLSKIAFIKEYFTSITLSNAYRSSYSVGSFATNIRYRENEDGYSAVKNNLGNYISKKEFDQVSISEQFSPLIGIDMTWINSFSTKFEIKKSRTLGLSFVNYQLTEMISNEFVIGLGYRIKDLAIGVRSSGKRSRYQSDLNLKGDFSIRTNKTILRKINELVNQISAGQKVLSLSLSADYMLTKNFTVRAFFDKVLNNPYVSSQFLNSTTNAGVSLRFTLQ